MCTGKMVHNSEDMTFDCVFLIAGHYCKYWLPRENENVT